MTALRESVEELLELLWTAEEDGLLTLDRHALPASLRCFLPSPIDEDPGDLPRTVEEALAQGVAESAGTSHIRLSTLGRLRAAEVVRRHRLAEHLLTGVLEVPEDAVESTACKMEHILNAEVTDAVCAFLGHPPACPHARLIPRGPCCLRATAAVEPLIAPLAQLAVGEEGRVAFIHTKRSSYRQRLSLLGLVPGSRVTVRQLRSALVVASGETELALDRQAGQEIFVRRCRADRHPRPGSGQGDERHRPAAAPSVL